VNEENDIHDVARSFVLAAFETLRKERVVPTSVFNPYVRVGRDFSGPSISSLVEYGALENALKAAYPERFQRSPAAVEQEFAASYVFSLLAGAVARCGVAGNFSAASPEVTETIDELVALLEGDLDEVVCCRVVSHIRTGNDEPVTIGEVEVVPVDDDFSRRTLEDVIKEKIPAAPVAFNRDPPFSFDPPHSLLVTRTSTGDGSPFEAAEALTARLERFLLHIRLLTATTAQSYYEVRGSVSLVGRLPSELITFGKGMLDSDVRRTPRLAASDEKPVGAIASLIDTVVATQEGMAFTSLGLALQKFQTSYRPGSPLERLVDLATALEATLAGASDENEGLTLRLRGRAAALLATDDDPAKTIFDDIGLLYGIRSTIVHGGEMKATKLKSRIGRVSTVGEDERSPVPSVALGHAVDRMRDLVRRAILARLSLATGPDPRWPLGGHVPSVDAQLSDDAVRKDWRDAWHSRIEEMGAASASGKVRGAAASLSELEK
jgi:hypothetical protein